MRNLKRTSGLLGLMLLMSIAISAQPYGGGDCPYKGEQKGKQGNMEQGENHRQERMAAYLELTDEQKTKIEAIKFEHQKKMLPLRNELGEKRARMKTLSTAETVDMKAINSLIDEMAGIKTKMAKDRAAMHQEIRKILTTEQRVKFDLHAGNKGGRGNMERGR